MSDPGSMSPPQSLSSSFPGMSERSKRLGLPNLPADDNPLRTAVRFPMKLPVRLETENGHFDATTENISANGILLTGPMLPAVDSKIEFTINMPSAVMGSETDVTIHCSGRVVRHQQQGREQKAAAVIDEYFLKA